MDELERCKPWIEAALEHSGGTHWFEDVVEGVRIGTMQLWPAPKGCVVTEIIQHPRKKTVHIFLAGGEMDQILDMFKDVSAWAKAQGCTAMTQAGRKGWTRVLGQLGFETLCTTMTVEL